MCAFSILGHVSLIFYPDNPYVIYFAWNFMGFATFIYLTNNINEQCARWPGIGMVQKQIMKLKIFLHNHTF